MGKIKYYLKRIKGASFKRFKKVIDDVNQRSGKNKLLIFFDIINCMIRYSAGYMDYYYYFFEELNKEQRRSMITRGANNSYIRKLNNQQYGHLFDDKIEFNQLFKDYIKRDYLDLNKANYNDFEQFLKKHSLIILKPVNLQCGKDIEKIKINSTTDLKKLYANCLEKKQLLIEECVIQHDEMNKLFPSSVNTLRIVTAKKKDETKIMFRSIRIGNGDNVVDNFNHGGMYSIIDQNGIISKPAIDKKSQVYEIHPVTKTKIKGFEIPYFKEAIDLCKKASEVVPGMGLVGWDVAITNQGPVLIEGNNFPGYDIYQSKVHLHIDGTGLRPYFDEIILNKNKNSKFRFFLAFYYYKIFLFFQKILGKEKGIYPTYTKVIFKICPTYLKMIAKPKQIISVMGTNGKTTLCNLLKDVLMKQGYTVINNNEYSLKTGIAHALTRYAKLNNTNQYDYAIIETDELTSNQIFNYFKPDYIVMTNLFRDSLKKNDNVDYILNVLKEAIPEDTKLILNADDLISSSLKNEHTKFYSISKLSDSHHQPFNIVKDITICPKCYHELKYDYVHYNHLGKASCPSGHYTNEKADYQLSKVVNNEIIINNQNYPLISSSIFNIYNELALISLLNEIKIPTPKIIKSLKNINITDSRLKIYKLGNQEFICHLAKGQNPVACSSVFNYVKNDNSLKNVILMLDDLEDNHNSSETISWLYDTDFEFLNDEKIKNIIVGGPRCYDMKVRLLMAGINENKIKITEEQDNIPKLVSIEGIDKLYFLYDLVSLNLAKKIEQEIIGKFGDNHD